MFVPLGPDLDRVMPDEAEAWLGLERRQVCLRDIRRDVWWRGHDLHRFAAVLVARDNAVGLGGDLPAFDVLNREPLTCRAVSQKHRVVGDIAVGVAAGDVGALAGHARGRGRDGRQTRLARRHAGSQR